MCLINAISIERITAQAVAFSKSHFKYVCYSIHHYNNCCLMDDFNGVQYCLFKLLFGFRLFRRWFTQKM